MSAPAPAGARLIMPLPPTSDQRVPKDWKKVCGVAMPASEVAEFTAALKYLGWKSRTAWLRACVEAVIEQTAEARSSTGTPF